MWSISVSRALKNEICRPRYFHAPESGTIPMSMSSILVEVAFGLPVRNVALLRIFVLSGWSSRPLSRAAARTSCSMFRTWCKDVPINKTSSANRKCVIQRVAPSLNPQRLRLHLALTVRMASSNSALNSRELRGSPCFVPRWMTNCLLILSVRTRAVCPEYRCCKSRKYPSGTPCRCGANHKLSNSIESNALRKVERCHPYRLLELVTLLL